MASLQGKVGRPRAKYVHTVEKGFRDGPSNLNNVETYANVPWIIANGEPRSVGEVVNAILGAAGLPPERRSLPLRLALALGRACELANAVVPFRGGPPMTRFIARSLATAHWYDLGAACRDLGYTPRVSFEDGIGRLAAWFRTNS